ncbi:hypothetical protein PSTG_03417 [Puccinia striiformis f. sp. tritici PST-78]|uniref:Uncharacterized protein n=1 Tax=Puccinia striiformis f. sp. tritici PST-78 TaxID=1165861 RepID=A0A0L0VW15_9BASI|nr:hypothetical protein PSTG_03417 [Puccinia striiformis f. sp. tritici PST-78]
MGFIQTGQHPLEAKQQAPIFHQRLSLRLKKELKTLSAPLKYSKADFRLSNVPVKVGTFSEWKIPYCAALSCTICLLTKVGIPLVFWQRYYTTPKSLAQLQTSPTSIHKKFTFRPWMFDHSSRTITSLKILLPSNGLNEQLDILERMMRGVT